MAGAATDSSVILASSACDACFSANLFEANLVIIGLLRIIATAQNPMAATDAKTLLASPNAACDAECGMQFPLVIIGLLRIIAGGGGGGATGGSITAANYGGGVPNFTPAAGVGEAIDTSNGRVWLYYSGAWH